MKLTRLPFFPDAEVVVVEEEEERMCVAVEVIVVDEGECVCAEREVVEARSCSLHAWMFVRGERTGQGEFMVWVSWVRLLVLVFVVDVNARPRDIS